MPKKRKKKAREERSRAMDGLFEPHSSENSEEPPRLQPVQVQVQAHPEDSDSPDIPEMASAEQQPGEGGDLYCDGPGARTRSKVGQEPYAKLSSPSFLVQIPFYAFKKEKNRKCSICGKHGRTPSDLLRHMRVHTGERPFPCVGCDKKFKCKRSQLTHQYLTHSITDGLSNHRLQILELKKLRRPAKAAFPLGYDLSSALEIPPQVDSQDDVKPPPTIDQDEDTEIVAGEESSTSSEIKTSFEGVFAAKQDVPEEEKTLNDISNATSELSGAEFLHSNGVGYDPAAGNLDEGGLLQNDENHVSFSNDENHVSFSNDENHVSFSNDENQVSFSNEEPTAGTPSKAEPLKVPILRIKTHKCTHCRRQFRSIYTLRYHLRSMHDEKVYLSPALESRLKKRRWLPPHVRLQKPKINLSLGLLLKNKAAQREVADSSPPDVNVGEPEPVAEEPKQDIPSPADTFPVENHALEEHQEPPSPEQSREQLDKLEAEEREKETENAVAAESEIEPSAVEQYPVPPVFADVSHATIKTEKQDSVSDEGSDQHEPLQSTDLNNNSNNSTLRNILTSKESLFNHLHQYSSSSFSSQIPAATAANSFSKSASNSYIVPPHIFLPSNSQIDERLESNKPVSWESLRVTSENVLVTKMEAVHPTTHQKYVLYKCSQCGKAYSGLHAISVHLASHNDNTGKDCEKCGASFKWQDELDSHIECHRSDRKYMPSSPFLPSYYVNPFPIPVLPTGEQTMMPTTGLLSYPFFPMPQQISPLVQPGFFPFFAAALQPSSQIPMGDSGAPPPANGAHSPTEAAKENLEEKNLPQNCSFQCKLCPKTFDRIFSLQRHERIHSGVKACFCKTCGRGFSELRNLRHHIVRFHADTAKMEPLPYRRQPTRVRSSSQRLVSFLKKTAVRILNSMGQNKIDPPASSVKIQTDDLAGHPSAPPSDEVPQNLSRTQPKEAEQQADPAPAETNSDKQAERPPSEASEEPKNLVNYVKVPEMEDLPTVNGVLSDITKSGMPAKSNNAPNSRPLEVMHDPKRSLLGNRRKGRPFKLSTSNSCNFLNPIADENLFAITQKILNGMPKLNIEQPGAFLTPPQPVGTSIPSELAMPQLSFFNSELPSNEPLDMSNVREKAPPPEIKIEPNQNGEPINNENTSYSSLAQINEVMNASAKIPEFQLQGTEAKCMFPCSYCHRSFNTLSDLNRHMTFHADIRPFKCPYCSYCSRTNSQLKVHMMRHEGIKHYMCQICNYNGVTQSDLNRHLKTRTHLLRSRNICACCGTGFHTRSLSEEHYKSCRLLGSAAAQEQAKNSEASSGRLVMENKNRGNRLKHVQKPKEDPDSKKEFFKNLYELGKMGVPFADFLQQNNAINVVK